MPLNSIINPRVIVVGEILFDVINGQKFLGGAPFNFAYHLLHLGFPVFFISRIGNDDNGKTILKTLNGFQFPIIDIQIDPFLNTGTVIVELDRNGNPAFDILAPAAYDNIEYMKESHLPILNEADCIYFGSLAQRSDNGLFHIQQLLSHVPSSSTCFYDINLRPDCYSENVITNSLRKATILKINENELEVCRQIFQWEGNSKIVIHRLMEKFHLEQVILTKGSSGSSLYKKDGFYQSGPVSVKTMSDSVGAGDAFAAMFCACTLNNWKPENVLLGASKFASRICEIKGAIPESPGLYAPFKEMIKNRSPHGTF